MKAGRWFCLAAVALLPALSGCERHGHRDQDEAGHDHGESHENAESFTGATHKVGKGITLLDETRTLLGIQTVEVQEQKLPHQIRFVAHSLGGAAPMAGVSPAPQLALGTVQASDAIHLRAGMPVQLRASSGATVTGEVHRVTRPLTVDEAEVIVSFRSPAPVLQHGGFGEATVSVPGEKTTLVVPGESVIHGANGDLVYAVNGDAYVLTWVTRGAMSGGMVEVVEGLLPGDSVVTRGALDLWLIELRAMKGGQGCCPVPPAKGKK